MTEAETELRIVQLLGGLDRQQKESEKQQSKIEKLDEKIDELNDKVRALQLTRTVVLTIVGVFGINGLLAWRSFDKVKAQVNKELAPQVQELIKGGTKPIWEAEWNAVEKAKSDIKAEVDAAAPDLKAEIGSFQVKKWQTVDNPQIYELQYPGDQSLGVSDDQGFCFVSKVYGTMNGGPGGKATGVEVKLEGNEWHLVVTGTGPGVNGHAVCVRFSK